MPVRLPVLCAALLCALATASSASAATITVTSEADDGAGTLRAALATAGTGDTVSLPAGHYVLSTGTLTVPGGVTIAGAGARTTSIDANHASGVLDTSGTGVVLSDVTVTGGHTAGSGGGIDGGFGLTLHRVAVVGNASDNQGGGIFLGGTGSLLIDHSLIAGNQAASGGGGLYLTSTVANSSIVDSTIAGNLTASSVGGGFATGAVNLLLDGDTIVDNHAPAGTGGNFRVASNGVATMRDTILAGGLALDADECYLSGGATLTSLGHNVEADDPHPDTDCQGSFTAADRTGLVLQLGALQDNGGPTDTILPPAGSPAVDQGDPAACLGDDARGVVRPQGAGCDVGAVERVGGTVGAAFADGLAATTATLHGTADTAGLGGSARFAYGPTAAYGAFTGVTPLPAATGPQGAGAGLTGLLPATTYHFRLEVTTPDGLSAGPDATFTTPSVPAPGGPGLVAPPTSPFVRIAVAKVTATSTGATLTLSCTGSAGTTCRGTTRLQTVERLQGKKVLALSASAAKAKKKAKVKRTTLTVGQKSYTVAAGRSLKLTVTLTKAGRSLLTHFKRLPARVAVTLTGLDGKTTTVATSKALTLKPAKKKKAPHKR